MNLPEVDEALEEMQDYLNQTQEEIQSMRSFIWTLLPEARLSPEEQLDVARGDAE